MQKYDVRAMPEPLSPAIVEKLMKVEAATIGHFRHHGFMHHTMRPLLDRKVVGCAVTIAIPGADSTLLHHALGLARPGDFFIIDRLGDERHACWGGGVSRAAMAAGIVGAALDGPCTDPGEIREGGFPLWCRGVSPITTRIYDLGGAMNVPVACAGAAVSPGDIVIADDSGVVVIGRHEADAIADHALERQARGEKTQVRIKAGEKLGDISGATAKVLAALQQG
jgi:4-hydroxy-4-methyl-2-oxoglutarate aldolase